MYFIPEQRKLKGSNCESKECLRIAQSWSRAAGARGLPKWAMCASKGILYWAASREARGGSMR